MNLSFGIKLRGNPQSHQGFALITALSLMAFMLVLVVTLLSLMEVETRSASSNLELQKAREGARLALNMAIGQLQEYAGNDQRVTARADITGSATSEANHWTGVWDTSSSDPTPINPSLLSWLVSGIATPTTMPSTLDDTNSLGLVDIGSVSNTNEHVRAPFINIFDKNGNVTSRIAWWTGDEGTKASVAQLPLVNKIGNPAVATDPLRPSFTPDNSLNTLQTMLTTTHGLEELFSGYDQFNTAADADSLVLDRVTDIGQLNSLSEFSGTWQPGSESAFHTITPMSLGLLASTTNRGLMQDLSLFPGLIGVQFENYINEGFQAAATNASATDPVAKLKRSVSLRGIDDMGGVPPTAGAIARPVAPVLTNLMISFALFETVVGAKSLLRMHFFCELWNPYTNSLLMNDGTNDLDLELEISGLPQIQIQSNTTGTAATVDLNAALGNPLTVRLDYDSNKAWFPGMTKNWTGINGSFVSSQDSTGAKNWDSPSLTLGNATGIATDADKVSGPIDTVNLSSAGNTTIVVKLYSVGHSTGSNKRLLNEVNGVIFSNVNVPSVPLGETEESFSYHFILKGPYLGNSDTTYPRGRWLFDNDPRHLSFPSGTNAYTATKDGFTIPAILPKEPHDIYGGASPTDNVKRPQRLFDRSDDGGAGDYNKIWQDAPLFELPRERILSLASLQHLYFHNERPFKVGNSWGNSGATNTLAWFDDYFFSGFNQADDPGDPDDLTTSGFSLRDGFPNPILTSYEIEGDSAARTILADWRSKSLSNTADTAAAKEPAQKLLVANRFNLNSTSVEAWKAVLGGLRINGWRYVQESPLPDGRTGATTTATTSRSRLFTRFPQSIQETYHSPPSPDPVTTAPTEYYRHGARYLKDSQITALAQQIVALLKSKGSPFTSMERFLEDTNNSGNGSLLEKAIAAALNTGGQQQWDQIWETAGTGTSTTIPIDHFSPGFLTQADIMTAIGPMLAPRSDTFKIRARCQTLSPFNSDEVIGDATIEAIVQRVPDKLNPGDDINNSIDRKFKIMSVRWLSADEI